MATNLGALADAIYAKREEVAQAQAVADELGKEQRAMENELLAAMQEAGTDIARGSSATVSITILSRLRPSF
jgi:hypothetical protein